MKERSRGGSLVSVLAAGLVTCGVVPASAYPIAPARASCQERVATSVRTFVAAKDKCIAGCQRRARQGKNPFADCEPPFGGRTAICLFDTLRGAETRAALAISRSCASDCPVCYAPGCAVAQAVTPGFGGVIDWLNAHVFCSTGGSARANHCRERVRKTILGYARGYLTVYRRCFMRAQRGLIPGASCAPPTPADGDTSSALLKLDQRGRAIDAACLGPRDEAPACYGVLAPGTGAEWISLMRSTLDTLVPFVYCGSPSGAFLE